MRFIINPYAFASSAPTTEGSHILACGAYTLDKVFTLPIADILAFDGVNKVTPTQLCTPTLTADDVNTIVDDDLQEFWISNGSSSTVLHYDYSGTALTSVTISTPYRALLSRRKSDAKWFYVDTAAALKIRQCDADGSNEADLYTSATTIADGFLVFSDENDLLYFMKNQATSPYGYFNSIDPDTASVTQLADRPSSSFTARFGSYSPLLNEIVFAGGNVIYFLDLNTNTLTSMNPSRNVTTVCHLNEDKILISYTRTLVMMDRDGGNQETVADGFGSVGSLQCIRPITIT